jgi:hypothetical protein
MKTKSCLIDFLRNNAHTDMLFRIRTDRKILFKSTGNISETSTAELSRYWDCEVIDVDYVRKRDNLIIEIIIEDNLPDLSERVSL